MQNENSYPIESQYDRALQIENFVRNIITENYVMKPNLIRTFASFRDKRTVPENITWEQMKKEFGWGYAKGSRIDPLVTWIYIRTDVKNSLKQSQIALSEVFTNLVLNEHYFIVEKKAIAYLKTHCHRIQYDNILSEEGEEEEEEEEVSLLYTIKFLSLKFVI